MSNVERQTDQPYDLKIGGDEFKIHPYASKENGDMVSGLINGAIRNLAKDLQEKEITIYSRKHGRTKARASVLNDLRVQADLMREHIKILKGAANGEISFIKSRDNEDIVGIRVTDNKSSIRHIKRVTTSRTS